MTDKGNSATYRRVAGQLRAIRDSVARDVAAFFDVQVSSGRYDAASVERSLKDTSYQVESLAAAIETNSVEAFSAYREWVVQTLQARRMDSRFLTESLAVLEESAAKHAPEIADTVARFISAAAALHTMPRRSETRNVLGTLMQEFLDAILAGNRYTAVKLLGSAYRAGHSVLDLYTDVVQEALYEVGRLWQSNRITISDEHRATAVTQFVLAQFYPLIPPPVQKRCKVLIAGVEGELHQMGSLLVADALEADGWDVVFLGANTPSESIVEAVEFHQPDVLGLSATMLFSLPLLMRAVDLVRASPHAVRMVAGGAAVQSVPGLCEQLGLDGCPHDVRGATVLFRELEQGINDAGEPRVPPP